MRRYRGKAIAFGLVAMVGATSTSLADAAEEPTAISGPALPATGASSRSDSGATFHEPVDLGTTAFGTTLFAAAALGTTSQLGERLQAASHILDRFAPAASHPLSSGFPSGAAPRPALAARTATAAHPVGTSSRSGASGAAGGAALLQPTLSRVVNLISKTTGGALATDAALPAPASPVLQGPGAPAFALQAEEQAGEQGDEPPAEPAPEELAAAAHAARTEDAFQARPDAASAIAASAPQYVTRPYVPGAPSEADLEKLRWCESGGNYASVSAGGWYRGAYQFDFSTWDSVASRWMPHLVGTDPAAAAPADQDLLASALYSERGWQPWPTCGL